jgi:hypothetical protein|tara:strand:+ start:30 stop:437 length:408 start_codon:yes stop_codon:yes gene_type:complete
MSKEATYLADQLRSLRKLGTALQSDINHISLEERKFLGEALINIGNGLDPRVELGVNIGAGQISARNSIIKDKKLRNFGGWLHVAMMPCSDGGLGLTLEAAVAECAGTGAFNLSEETLRTYASRYIEYRKEIFEL